jgi:uncharacterized NAD-dependent epimerase/dehydratase family protein
MKLVLEISQETDLKMLLMLLERLKIPYTKLAEKNPVRKLKPAKAVANGASGQKNYDETAIEKLLAEIQQRQVFNEITDPVEWQKKVRDEWE